MLRTKTHPDRLCEINCHKREILTEQQNIWLFRRKTRACHFAEHRMSMGFVQVAI